MAKLICGIDVSLETLDARLGRAGATAKFPRSQTGIKALADFCKLHKVSMVAMEATGGLERLPFSLLWTLGVPAAILNPRAVRRFAEGMGYLEKTDRLDSGLIAWFADVKEIEPQQPAREVQDRLEALVTRLRQLTDLRTAQSNQCRLVTEPMVLSGIDELLALIARQVKALEKEIATLIQADPLWKALDKAFREIKGVADRTVARLMAELPEIGTLTSKAVAKLAGLAPLAQDSGKVSGRRPIRAGRVGIRSILFVVAEIVRRHDPSFAAFHKKLSDAGKPKKVIRVAIARKLLVRLNAKARDTLAEIACTA